jgi:hypothetical protein
LRICDLENQDAFLISVPVCKIVSKEIMDGSEELININCADNNTLHFVDYKYKKANLMYNI